MSRNVYKIWAMGSPVGLGVTNSVHVGIAGIAKKSSTAFPYIVANEIVCNRIAQALLLPCPPGALTQHNGDTYFFSLDFNLAGMALPPASPISVIAHDPELAWRIILFDILVMNGDRHSQNISFDRTTSTVQIYDHGHAFAGPTGDAEINLLAKSSQLAISNHCLAGETVELAQMRWGFPANTPKAAPCSTFAPKAAASRTATAA